MVDIVSIVILLRLDLLFNYLEREGKIPFYLKQIFEIVVIT